MPKILIIDDDPIFLQLLKHYLLESGYSVVEAKNGQYVLETLKNEKPDLVITDLIMPDHEGIETITTIRESHPDLPVIAMSSEDNIEYLDMALLLKANDIITKPITEEAVLNTVNKYLN